MADAEQTVREDIERAIRDARDTPRLRRLSYQRYEIADGPAAGTVLRASDNPTALPCFRWIVESGVRHGNDGFTLHGLARACTRRARG